MNFSQLNNGDLTMSRNFLSIPTMFFLALAGCGGQSSGPSGSIAGVETGAPSGGADHAHGAEGPHGGSLIELGNEEYHAEMVHDEQAGTITIYVLDSAAKTGVPIEATEVVINLKHEGRGEQFKLAASTESTDPAGQSSRFVSSDAELAADLDHEDAEAELVVMIQGKPYRGAIEHHHGHDEHDHVNENR
jgi:hypothetical protein